MTNHHPIIPARLVLTGDGVPWSDLFADVYHSADGGLDQARHVFMAGNGLPVRWRGADRFTIVETGFGQGLNFLATWQAWAADPARCGRLHFVSAEKHPFRRGDLARLHARLPELAALSAELLAAWPPLVPGFHRLELAGGRVVLTLLFGDALDALPRLDARPDAIYLDGFSPDRNPELWSPPLFAALARLGHRDTTLATYTVAGGVRQGLMRAGFAVEKRPGFGRKRHMLAGRYAPPDWRPAPPPPAAPEDRRALVIGAGMAGTAAAERLAARGWRVDVIDRHDGPAGGASGNPAGILMPLPSRDDNLTSQFTRMGYLYALRELGRLARGGGLSGWAACGVLQLAEDDAAEALMARIADAQGFPEDYARFVPRGAASALAGLPVPAGGWLFPGGGAVAPAALCRARLDADAEGIRARYGAAVACLAREDGEWVARDAEGRALARASVAILANAADAALLAPGHTLPLERVRGQVTTLPPGLAPPRVVCRDGYLAPAAGATACLGATYDFDTDPAPSTAANAENLRRLEDMLPGASSGLDPAALSGRVSFRAVSSDRLPLVGALPDPDAAVGMKDWRLPAMPRLPGLFALAGFGSRGLVWSPLAAELLAARLENDPLPLPRELADALDPARFLMRALRRGGRPER